MRQAAQRGLMKNSTFVLALGESSLQRIGKDLPDGVIVGARGDHYFLHPENRDDPKFKSFMDAFKQRTGSYPIYCQSALDWDPLSASKRDPFERRVRPVALAPSELAGVAETVRARAV